MPLGYLELKAFWVRGFRNGNLYRLGRIARGFYKACLIYARVKGRIVRGDSSGRQP